MSIIVYGVDKPSRCRNCPFCIASEPDSDDSPYECVINQYLHWATWTDVPLFISEGCKIGEIPKLHGKLIDADRLIVALRNSVYANTFFRTPTLTMSQIEQLIEHQPAVIEAEQGDG